MTLTTTGGFRPAKTDADERLAYLALAQVPGLGATRLARLLSTFGSATATIGARASELQRTGIGTDAVHAIQRVDPARIDRQLSGWRDEAIEVLVPGDDAFPSLLRTIPDPPTMLWMRGDLSTLRHPALAIVGSRDHTPYGATVARQVAAAAAGARIVVVSGMARGLDAVAHAAALDAGWLTVGVLGNGVDVVYPRQNAVLYDRVIERGLLLSEHPPGEPVLPGAFPRRNRLISGLARAVVVVEAADGSGTMLTVASALEQGREVLAVPGQILSATSSGTNRLIRDGATPLLEPAQVLALFGVDAPVPPAQLEMPCTFSRVEAQVFNALGCETLHVDDIALAAGLPIGAVLGTLLGLELGSFVEQLPGDRYRRGSR